MRSTSLACALFAAAGIVCASASPRGDHALTGRSLAAGVLSKARLVRTRGCADRTGIGTPLNVRRPLEAAARELASGADLEQATRAAGYAARLAVDLRLSGDLTPQSITRLLATRFCSQLTNPALRDIGVYGLGHDVWMIAAAPFATTPAATESLADTSRVTRRVLRLVNAARAAGRHCGDVRYGPAAPLTPSRRLRRAARAHSRDMAVHAEMSHVGHDGSTAGERVTRTGFTWSAVGENIAEGQTSAASVVRAWLASPPHCANIMDPEFTATGVAFSIEPRGRVYWTEDFARPLAARKPRR